MSLEGIDVCAGAFALWVLTYQFGLALGMSAQGICITFALCSAITVAGLVAGQRRWKRWRVRFVRPRAFEVIAGTVLVALALLVRRPDADDAMYVRWASWIAERGFLPERDIVFTAHVRPLTTTRMPFAYETMVGSIARVLHVEAATIMYVAALPVLGLLSATAIVRLLATWRVPRVPLALTVVLTFLIFDAVSHGSPGNFFIARIWQPKVILVAIVVPYVLAAMSAWMRRSGLVDAARVFIGVVVMAGLSGTSYIIAPLIAISAVLTLVILREWRRALFAPLLFIYPAFPFLYDAVELVNDAAATAGQAQSWSGIASFILGPPTLQLVIGLAVLAGILSIKDQGVRIFIAIVCACAIASATTPVQAGLNALTGMGSVLWRVAWIAPIAVLCGSGFVHLLELTLRLRGRAGVGFVATGSLALVLAVGFALHARPVWSAANGASIALGWKVDTELRGDALDLSRMAHERKLNVVSVPVDVANAIYVSDATLTTTNTRYDYFDQDAKTSVQRQAIGVVLGDGSKLNQEAAAALNAFQSGLICVRGEEIPLDNPYGWRRLQALRTCTVFTNR